MLVIEISTQNSLGKHTVALCQVIELEPHTRLKQVYWYEWSVKTDEGQYHIGRVLHTRKNGPVALVARVAKAFVKQQKATSNE